MDEQRAGVDRRAHRRAVACRYVLRRPRGARARKRSQTFPLSALRAADADGDLVWTVACGCPNRPHIVRQQIAAVSPEEHRTVPACRPPARPFARIAAADPDRDPRLLHGVGVRTTGPMLKCAPS